MNFCRRCGTPLAHDSNTLFICEKGHRLYSSATPTVGVFFITGNNEVLLSVRGIDPFKGTLDSFGGFVDENETVEQALAREIKEELGLSPNDYEKPMFLSTEISTYPYGGEDLSVLSMFFWSLLSSSANPIANDDVANLVTVRLSDISLSDIGNNDVRSSIKKLQKLFLH